MLNVILSGLFGLGFVLTGPEFNVILIAVSLGLIFKFLVGKRIHRFLLDSKKIIRAECRKTFASRKIIAPSRSFIKYVFNFSVKNLATIVYNIKHLGVSNTATVSYLVFVDDYNVENAISQDNSVEFDDIIENNANNMEQIDTTSAIENSIVDAIEANVININMSHEHLNFVASHHKQ